MSRFAIRRPSSGRNRCGTDIRGEIPIALVVGPRRGSMRSWRSRSWFDTCIIDSDFSVSRARYSRSVTFPFHTVGVVCTIIVVIKDYA
ncbi:hypothetical protein Scep_001586 [Stephania cephalantha]|uniref:Uncharacterized protein n=1 Tax=Stephania cephalantha TaxID=152367 RepID=A0AAP0LB30_9MAGN